jgi:hypothetical protein
MQRGKCRLEFDGEKLICYLHILLSLLRFSIQPVSYHFLFLR